MPRNETPPAGELSMARIPTGFMAAITVGQLGERLTEMAELAEVGAAGFTDDGLPVRSAGVMRQALQYQLLAGRVIALHEEDPSLSGDGAMHEGAISALLGVAGIPSVSESTNWSTPMSGVHCSPRSHTPKGFVRYISIPRHTRTPLLRGSSPVPTPTWPSG